VVYDGVAFVIHTKCP